MASVSNRGMPPLNVKRRAGSPKVPQSPPESPRATSKRFVILDSFRGVCACIIVFYHFHTNSHFHDITIIKNSYFFVDFFFVLSGFVIFMNYGDKLKEDFVLRRFMLLRFGRIYPLHLATFMAFVSVELIKIVVPSSGVAESPPFTDQASKLEYIVHHLLLIHSFGVGERLSFNVPSWSISAEFYTYIIFGIFMMFMKIKTHYFVILFITTMLASLIFLVINDEVAPTVHFGIFRCIYGFFSGVLCAMLWKIYNTKIPVNNVTKIMWSVLETLALILIIAFISLAHNTPFVYLSQFIFMLTIFIFSYEIGIISSYLKHKFFVSLGILSYSIYMNHDFIAGKLYIVLGIDMFTNRLDIEKWHGDALVLVNLLIVIIISYITHRVIEEPFRKYFRDCARRLYPSKSTRMDI